MILQFIQSQTSITLGIFLVVLNKIWIRVLIVDNWETSPAFA